MCLDQTDFVQTCAVVLSHVSIRVEELFHWAPLRALHSRMSTCWWYRASEPLDFVGHDIHTQLVVFFGVVPLLNVNGGGREGKGGEGCFLGTFLVEKFHKS